MWIIFALLLIAKTSYPITKTELQNIFKQPAPFSYNLGIKVIPGKQTNSGITICCHGYGSSCEIGDVIHSFNAISDHLVSFNFPDYDCIRRKLKVDQTVFGSIDEILPLLYVLKKCVIDGGMERINVYGFSAGGGAIINILATLNKNTYDDSLKKIGIDAEGKKKIITALEKGLIILDCPLKSMDEIVELWGKDPDIVILAQRYRDNGMRPVDAIKLLEGLKLTILVHFQVPDEMIGNRDDKLFIERLKATNKGITKEVFASEGGHNTYHRSLWDAYKNIKK